MPPKLQGWAHIGVLPFLTGEQDPAESLNAKWARHLQVTIGFHPTDQPMPVVPLQLLLLTIAAPTTQELAVTTTSVPAVLAPATRDSAVIGAEAALDEGRPWQASRLIAPVLADSSRRTPEAVFVAASAASQWGGWPEVARLLDQEHWLDSLYDGRARLLLARAALEAHDDSAALRQVLAARPRAVAQVDGERLVLLASVLDRLGARDSAAATYARAADRLPLVAEWLRVRQAAVTDDSAARAAIAMKVLAELPRGRLRWSEAEAHRHTGDLVTAASRYDGLGATLTALGLRLVASNDSGALADVRHDLLGLAASGTNSEVRGAVAILDSAFTPLDAAEELAVAGGAERAGLLARAAEAYAAALAARLGRPEDRLAYAGVLTRLGRYGDAAFQYDQIRSPRALAAAAAYGRARALVRGGQLSEARSALLEIGRKFRRDTSAAASALYLLGDIASDDRSDADARRYFRTLAARYPTSRYAVEARFRAAIIALVGGAPATAARELDRLAERYPRSDEAVAATYWAGRAWAAAGDSAIARARWLRVSSGDPQSYYPSLASRRLGEVPWTPPAAPDSFLPIPEVDSALTRAALLDRLGLSPESRWEYDRLARSPDSSAERLLSIADALRRRGFAAPAIQLARRALTRGAPPDARTYRLLYPLVRQDALLAEAAEQGLDPAFVAALIRQESRFDPSATSAAGARGLMQIMPEVGERLAQTLEFPIWDPVLLYQADVSLRLGTYHLQELASRYDQQGHILAAYNAGASRVDRWSERHGVDDPEVFAERIPFAETRGYVRAIHRNQEIYRALYTW
jgi:soluble lytic murein transglycosylase